MPSIDPDDPRQPFEQIAAHYRREIRSGRLASGDRLPSGREIAKLFDVAHGTATRAIDLLRQDGFIVAWQGRGVFVRDTPPDTGSDSDDMDAPRKRMSRLDRLEYELHELSRSHDELARRVSELERARTNR